MELVTSAWSSSIGSYEVQEDFLSYSVDVTLTVNMYNRPQNL